MAWFSYVLCGLLMTIVDQIYPDMDFGNRIAAICIGIVVGYVFFTVTGEMK